MATKSPLAYSSEPEDQQAMDIIRQSQKELMEALDRRRAPLFDPTLLAMAQGFLAPTKTGSFGESLGNVAAAVGPVQAAEEKRRQENAMMRMELAKQQLGMSQQARGERMFSELLGGMKPQDGTESQPGQPPQESSLETPQMRKISPYDIAKLASIPGMEGKAKALQDAVKAEQDRFVISQNGIVFDRAAGRYLDLDIPGQKQEEYTTPYGTFKMTPNEYARFTSARKQGQGEQWINAFRAGEAGIKAPTVAEEEARKKAQEARATETAKAEVGRTQEAIGSGDVSGKMGTYNMLQSLAQKPGADRIFGILAQPDVASGIAKLVETGIGIKGFSIGIPEIQNVLRNVNLPKDLISDAQLAASLVAEAQLQASRLGKGQGAVSNFERTLFATASLSMDDRPETVLRKVNMLRARAEFDRDVAKVLRQSKMDIDDFKDTPQYDNMLKGYMEKLGSVANPAGKSTKGSWKIIGVEK